MSKFSKIVNEIDKYTLALGIIIYPRDIRGNIRENNGETNPENVDFKFWKRTCLMFDSTALGYSHMTLYLDSSDELIALSLVDYEPKLITTLQQTKSFYGVKVKRMIKNDSDNFVLLYV